MSLLRKARTELIGAWRSLRYDLGRRPVEPPAGGPDMTSTGMNTFGGPVLSGYADAPPARQPVRVRRPRRAVTAAAFGVLTVVGATGAYLGVVNGLGSLMSERPAAADTFPARPAVTAKAQVGAGPVPGRAIRRPAPAEGGVGVGVGVGAGAGAGGNAAPAAVPPPPGQTVAPVPPGRRGEVRPVRTTNPAKPAKPAGEKCECGAHPPVPTPTAPTSSPSPTASRTSSAPSPSGSASASPSDSATPDNSAEPSEEPQGRHRRRHR
jgi:hypothetical protein